MQDYKLYQNKFTMKNRTIPLATKEEIEVQTEVNLINHDQDNQPIRNSEDRDVRFSDIVTESFILKSFSTNQVFQEMTLIIEGLKKEGSGVQNVEKRITLIEKELQGLMKRSLLVNQKGQKHQAGSDYYSIINQLQKQKIKLEYQLSYNGIKVQRYESKILELQKEITSLRQTVEVTKNSILQNKVYKDFISGLKEEKRIDLRKFTELQIQLKKINGANIKTSKINENANEEEANELWGYFAGQIQKLEKEGKMSKQNLHKSIYSFYQMNTSFNSEVSSNFEFRSKYEALSEKYQQLSSLFKQQIDQLSRENPSIKGLKNLEELIALTNVNEKQVELINVAGWIGIGKLSSGAGYFNASAESQVENKKLLISLARQLKLIIERYPKVLEEVSEQIRFLLSNGDFLKQMVETGSFARLKEIVTYQPEVIRVDNVYQYSNKKDQDLVFNLRVLVKSLLEQIEVIRKKYNAQITLDAGLLELMKTHAIEGINVEEILTLYRPLPKIIEVERIIQKPVYVNGTLQKGIPVRTQKAIIAEAFTQRAIEVIKEVPIYIEKIVNNPTKQYIEVQFQNEKIVEIPTIREVIAEKVLVNEKLNDVEVERIVPLYEEKIVEVESNKEVVVERTKIIEVEKPIEVPGQKQYIEIEKIVEKPVYIRQTRDRVKQIEVINQKIFERDRYIEIERQVPHVITNRETVYLDRQVPRFITNTEEREVNVTEIIEKIVPYKVIEERVVEVPVIQEKEIIRQVEKEVLVQMTHFIKGDRQEIIKEVEVVIEKPYRQEFLITKDVEIEKVVPLYFKEEKPVYVEMQMPYIQSEPRIINQQIARIVPVREQIIKEVRVEVPVPVIVERQVIKIETVFVDRIIQKIVEVPRIVEIQRIVQKIVPIPRIIEKIIEVPRIVQKIVTIEVPCLQIVEVFREIPVIREVEIIKEIIVDRPVIEYIKEIQIVERQKPVELIVEKQVPKEIEVERRIPTQVIRQIPVEVFRDRIVEKIIEIHEVTVKDREVVVPFKHEIPVEFIVEKPVVTQKIVENIVKVPQIIQKERPITNTITIPEIVQVRIQKPIQIEIVRQIPGPQTIKYIEVPKEIEVLREKVIQVQTVIEVPKQVFLYMDKIVHEYHDKLFPIHVPKIIEQPVIVQVNKPQHYIHYKEIPVEVQTNRNVPVRSIVDQIKQVEKEVHHEKEIQVFREKIKEIIRESTQYIERQVEKEILREVVVNETKVETFEIPGETKLFETNQTNIEVQPSTNYIEKVVERIVMLPQIVEVVKHLHSITEVQSPGVAVNVSIQEHTKQFTSVSTQLHASLIDLLEKFKQNAYRQPDLKNTIPIIESHLKMVEKWINFPKIVQVERAVEKIVDKEKVVLVPTSDHQREASLSYLVEKLVLELRRIKERNRIDLQLDQDIQRLFFKDLKSGVISEAKIQEFNETLKKQYNSLGEWRESYPFMINSFLQDYFTLNSTITEITKANASLQQQVTLVQTQLENNESQIIALNSHNAELLRNYSRILDVLRNAQGRGLNQTQIGSILLEFALSKGEQQRLSRLSESQARNSKRVGSSVQPYSLEEGVQTSNKQISTLISKTSKLESENLQLNSKLRSLEKQNKILESEISKLKLSPITQVQRVSDSQESSTSSVKVIQEIKSRLINENEQKIKRLQDAQNQQINRLKSTQEKQIERLRANQEKEIERIREQKSTSSNAEIVNEKRKIAEQLRNLKSELEVEKRSTESLKQQHERDLQNLKRQHEVNLQKKDSNISSIESVKTRISEDYERKIKQLKEFHEKELERFKAVSAARKEQPLKDDKEKEVNEYRIKIKSLEIELQTARKEVEIVQQQKSKMMSTAYTGGSIFTSGIKDPSELVDKQERPRERERDRYSPQHTKYTQIQTYQSAIERKYVSPSSVKSKQDDASSRKSSSSKRSERSSKYKAQMTLKEFMELEEKEDKDICSTFIMIKIIQKIEEEAKHGLLHSFSPSNIYLSNLNPKNLESLSIKFGAPIVNKNNKNDGLYLAPEILAGQKTTEKSIVFSLAVIWDELIHGQVYFKSMKDIENSQRNQFVKVDEFKVRDAKLNPILKNTLFEMMNKDPAKRLELHETKRRLSLQKYIASESKK